jgi:hypothetical protein
MADCSYALPGSLAWAMGDVKVDVAPNIDQVTPKARQLKY